MVHCFRGHGSTSQMVVTYLISRGMTAEAVVTKVLSLRTSADRRIHPSKPEVNMHSVQADAVRKFVIRLRKGDNEMVLIPEPLLVAKVV